jgi:hypothetical protein
MTSRHGAWSPADRALARPPRRGRSRAGLSPRTPFYRQRRLLILFEPRDRPLRASSDTTDARHSQAAQGIDREHPQAGSGQTAKDNAITPVEGRTGDVSPFGMDRDSERSGTAIGAYEPTKERNNSPSEPTRWGDCFVSSLVRTPPGRTPEPLRGTSTLRELRRGPRRPAAPPPLNNQRRLRREGNKPSFRRVRPGHLGERPFEKVKL